MKRINATFGGDDASQSPEMIEIHPDDASAKAITDGDKVRVWNCLGEVSLIARL